MSGYSVRHHEFVSPGKLFLFGEYLCLAGGPAILQAIEPRFHLSIEQCDLGTKKLPNFHPASPAGVLLMLNMQHLEGWSFEWRVELCSMKKQPLGVGTSSAEFLLTYLALEFIKGNQNRPNPIEILNEYWKLVGLSQGLRPSGVDILSQFFGGLLLIENKNRVLDCNHIETGIHFEGVKILVVETGKKVKTHDHLRALVEKNFPDDFSKMISELNEITKYAVIAIKKHDSKMFAELMNAYQNILYGYGITDSGFQNIIETLRTIPGVLGVKGSGAQGGDNILILVDAKTNVVAKIESIGFQVFEPKCL